MLRPGELSGERLDYTTLHSVPKWLRLIPCDRHGKTSSFRHSIGSKAVAGRHPLPDFRFRRQRIVTTSLLRWSCLLLAICVVPFASRGAAGQGGIVPTIRDVEYANVDGIPLLLDLYLPSTGNGPAPVIVWIHGGGWRAGTKAGGPAARQSLRGYAVASIDYRLSDVATHPAQINDCKAAIRWLRAHAGEYNLNPDRIAAYGSSAGGHLAAFLGTSGDVAELEGDVGGNSEYSSRVQAVVDWYGPAELLTMDAQALPCSGLCHTCAGSPESLMVGCTITSCPDLAIAASPIHYVSPDDPPFLIHHGTNDCTVPPLQSQVLRDALAAADVDVSLTFIDGAGHGGAGFATPAIAAEVDAFFDRVLLAPEPPPPSAPEITGAEIRDRKLIVTGARFADGAVILVDGAEQRTSNDPAAPDTTLVSRKARKRIDRGETVMLEVRNPDGETSEGFAYARP